MWLRVQREEAAVKRSYAEAFKANYTRAAPMLIMLAALQIALRAMDADLESFLAGAGRVGMGLGILLLALVAGSAVYTAVSSRARTALAFDLAGALAGAVTLLAAVMIPSSFGPNGVALVRDPTVWVTIAALGAVCAFAGRRIRNDYRNLYTEFRQGRAVELSK
jgi:hypothetical protein